MMKTLADELLANAIDMHCHCYPEFSLKSMKRMEDLEWITLAARMGMRGAVLKSHFWPTMTNVYYLQKQIPEGFKLFSSITLNVNCGGLVPWAVEAAASLGAKVVWMPTWSSKNDQKLKSMSKMIKKFVPSLESYEFEGLSVLDSQGLIPEAKKILQLAKDLDLVLFTGHLSAGEGVELARQAKEIGFKKLVFGHPDNPSIKASVEEMKEVSRWGAYVEFCFLGTLPLIQRKHPRDMVNLIREVGADRCILTTDSFYDWVPPEPEIMRMGIANLLELGISAEEMKLMVQDNPSKLLGI
jgi:hypothetical protein